MTNQAITASAGGKNAVATQEDAIVRPAMPIEIFGRYDAPHRSQLAAVRILLNSDKRPWISPIDLKDPSPEMLQAVRVYVGKMPSPAALSQIGLDIDRALDGPPASMTQIAELVAAMLDARPATRAGPQVNYASSMIYFLELEALADPFSVELLTAAILRMMRQQRFAPEPAEIIEQIAPARKAFIDAAIALDRLRDDLARAHDALAAANGRTDAPDDDEIPF